MATIEDITKVCQQFQNAANGLQEPDFNDTWPEHCHPHNHFYGRWLANDCNCNFFLSLDHCERPRALRMIQRRFPLEMDPEVYEECLKVMSWLNYDVPPCDLTIRTDETLFLPSYTAWLELNESRRQLILARFHSLSIKHHER